jgi:hypothetical protein
MWKKYCGCVTKADDEFRVGSSYRSVLRTVVCTYVAAFFDMIRYDIYLLQLGWRSVAVVGRLVQKQEREQEEKQYTKQYTKIHKTLHKTIHKTIQKQYKTIHKTQNTQNRKNIKQENKHKNNIKKKQKSSNYRGADKSLARPGRKQTTATEDSEFQISYL